MVQLWLLLVFVARASIYNVILVYASQGFCLQCYPGVCSQGFYLYNNGNRDIASNNTSSPNNLALLLIAVYLELFSEEGFFYFFLLLHSSNNVHWEPFVSIAGTVLS